MVMAAQPCHIAHCTETGACHMTNMDTAAAVEANRLYWETEDSVAEIADRLDLSRRALYDAIEPVPTGLPCPTCGGPLSFENRSARTAGNPTCPVCAATGATEADEPPSGQALPVPSLGEAGERALLVGGVAMAAAAVGALLTLALVPRR
jgi:hypothetical protein